MSHTEGPAYALAWSGGKDSSLALHRSRIEGRRVTHLLSIVDGRSGRVPYHGLRGELLRAQAEALGLELVLRETSDGAGFEEVFLDALTELSDLGLRGLVFGNIHLDDVRAWYEERVTDAGLEHVEPLWGGDPARLIREFVRLGYRSRVVSVQLDSPADPAWLGRDLDAEMLELLAGRPDVDPCGEKGEFHSFCWDGPLFRTPVAAAGDDTVEIEGHRILDLRADRGA